MDAGYAHTLPEESIPRRPRRSRYAIAIVAAVAIVALLTAGGVLQGVWIFVAVVAVAMVCCAPLAFGRPEPTLADERFETLLARCRQDRALAERLVAGESRRHPDRSRAAWIRGAIDRLDADRR